MNMNTNAVQGTTTTKNPGVGDYFIAAAEIAFSAFNDVIARQIEQADQSNEQRLGLSESDSSTISSAVARNFRPTANANTQEVYGGEGYENRDAYSRGRVAQRDERDERDERQGIDLHQTHSKHSRRSKSPLKGVFLNGQRSPQRRHPSSAKLRGNGSYKSSNQIENSKTPERPDSRRSLSREDKSRKSFQREQSMPAQESRGRGQCEDASSRQRSRSRSRRSGQKSRSSSKQRSVSRSRARSVSKSRTGIEQSRSRSRPRGRSPSVDTKGRKVPRSRSRSRQLIVKNSHSTKTKKPAQTQSKSFSKNLLPSFFKKAKSTASSKTEGRSRGMSHASKASRRQSSKTDGSRAHASKASKSQSDEQSDQSSMSTTSLNSQEVIIKVSALPVKAQQPVRAQPPTGQQRRPSMKESKKLPPKKLERRPSMKEAKKPLPKIMERRPSMKETKTKPPLVSPKKTMSGKMETASSKNPGGQKWFSGKKKNPSTQQDTGSKKNPAPAQTIQRRDRSKSASRKKKITNPSPKAATRHQELLNGVTGPVTAIPKNDHEERSFPRQDRDVPEDLMPEIEVINYREFRSDNEEPINEKVTHLESKQAPRQKELPTKHAPRQKELPTKQAPRQKELPTKQALRQQELQTKQVPRQEEAQKVAEEDECSAFYEPLILSSPEDIDKLLNRPSPKRVEAGTPPPKKKSSVFGRLFSKKSLERMNTKEETKPKKRRTKTKRNGRQKEQVGSIPGTGSFDGGREQSLNDNGGSSDETSAPEITLPTLPDQSPLDRDVMSVLTDSFDDFVEDDALEDRVSRAKARAKPPMKTSCQGDNGGFLDGNDEVYDDGIEDGICNNASVAQTASCCSIGMQQREEAPPVPEGGILQSMWGEWSPTSEPNTGNADDHGIAGTDHYLDNYTDTQHNDNSNINDAWVASLRQPEDYSFDAETPDRYE